MPLIHLLYNYMQFVNVYNDSASMCYTWIFIGYKFLSRADFGLISDHFL